MFMEKLKVTIYFNKVLCKLEAFKREKQDVSYDY